MEYVVLVINGDIDLFSSREKVGDRDFFLIALRAADYNRRLLHSQEIRAIKPNNMNARILQ